MFKVNEDGLPIEVWPPIKLTEADRAVIADDIVDHINLPRLRKVNGVWRQRSSLDTMEHGYRVYDEETETSTLDRINQELDALNLENLIQQVTADV